MKKEIMIGIIIFFLFSIISFLVIKYKAGKINSQNPKICCNNNCFNLEVANTDASRQLGLMYRESLGGNEGMLFVFDKPGLHSFRMKNTLIPLAGIWLDSNLKIVDIIQMEPCKTEKCPSYKPKSEAKYVLEINQGLISEKGLLHVGDSCKLTYSKLDFQKREVFKKIRGNRNILKSKFKFNIL